MNYQMESALENIVLSAKGMFLKPMGNPRGEKSASWG